MMRGHLAAGQRTERQYVQHVSRHVVATEFSDLK